MYYKIIPMLFLFVLYFCQPTYATEDITHQATIAKLQTAILILQNEIEAVGDTSKEILATLRGAGDAPGLVTKVAVNTNTISGLQVWMVTISTMLLGLFGWSIKTRISRK